MVRALFSLVIFGGISFLLCSGCVAIINGTVPSPSTPPPKRSAAPVVDYALQEKLKKEQEQKAKEARQASLEQFQSLTEGNAIIVSSAITSYGELVVEVPQEWHYQIKQIRLQGAQNIGKIWASCDTEGSGDFTIVDANGNEVGGRGFSGVWVSD